MHVDADAPNADAAATSDAGARPETSASLDATFAAGVGLFNALRRVATALVALLVAEARVARASVALVVLGTVALVAFAVSLWACVVALVGWTLFVATGSIGIALAILVALHLILCVAIWWLLKRLVQHASFPGTRSELRALGAELRGHVEGFQRAAGRSEHGDAP